MFPLREILLGSSYQQLFALGSHAKSVQDLLEMSLSFFGGDIESRTFQIAQCRSTISQNQAVPFLADVELDLVIMRIEKGRRNHRVIALQFDVETFVQPSAVISDQTFCLSEQHLSDNRGLYRWK